MMEIIVISYGTSTQTVCPTVPPKSTKGITITPVGLSNVQTKQMDKKQVDLRRKLQWKYKADSVDRALARQTVRANQKENI